VSDYYHKMKSMADSLGNLSYTISDHNLILNVLWGLNKRYDHFQTIITRSMPFVSFHRVWEDLVLEELTLSPNTPTPPPQPFYSNNTPAPPPPTPPYPPGNGVQGQGQGRDHNRYRKNGRGNGGGSSGGGGGDGRNASCQGNKPRHALSSWPSFYNPWNGTTDMYPGPAPGGPSTAASSHHCAWTDHGQPSIHTTLGVDPSSTTDVRRLAAAGRFSILDALARLMGPAVAGQLL
jgi:hypothetical protein